MEQRVSVLTLGVADLERARRFYEALGWVTNSDPDIGVVFFPAGGMVVGLWDRVLAEAEGAGAVVPRAGGKTFWGGYSGVFVDPDGHPWEVAHNPSWTIAGDGSVLI